MLVQDGMISPIQTIAPQAKLPQAAAILAHGHFHQLPVVDAQNHLLGILTDRDLRDARAQPDFEQRSVESAMTADPIIVHPDDTLEDAILLLLQQRFGALPVVDQDNRAVGIFTRHDCLLALVEVMGISEPGSRLEILIDKDAHRQVLTAINALAAHEDVVISAILSRCQKDGTRRLYVRLRTIDPGPLKEELTRAGLRILTPRR